MRLSLPSSIRRPALSISYFDMAWLALSPLLALFLRGDNILGVNNIFNFSSPVYEYVFLTFIVGLPVFIFFRINNGLTHLFTSKDVIIVFYAVSVSVLLSSYIVFSISRLDGIPRSVPLLYGVILFLGLIAYRVGVRTLYDKKITYERLEFDFHDFVSIKRVIIVGLSQFSISAIRLIDTQRPRSIQVVAVMSSDGRYNGRTLAGIKIIGKPLDFGMIIDEYDVHGIQIDEVWIETNDNTDETFLYLLERTCGDRNIVYRSLEDALNLKPGTNIDYRSMDFYLNNAISLNQSLYLRVKRLLDVFCSIALSTLLLPFFILLSAMVLYEIGPPVLFWQERIGLYGRKFLIYKLRTLSLPFDANGKIIDECSRMSPLGALIRRLRLDEIPQLLTILVGDMSGIGPRPLLPRDQPKENCERLLLRPGLTGWAQINGGELLNSEEKNALDCWYINNVSFKLDVQIVIKTIYVLFFGVHRNEVEIQKALDWYKARFTPI